MDLYGCMSTEHRSLGCKELRDRTFNRIPRTRLLRALLVPEERPAAFYRGYDVYDWQRVGFVSEGLDAERNGVRFDTGLRGNGNTGHLYGRELSAADRDALLEYLKTL